MKTDSEKLDEIYQYVMQQKGTRCKPSVNLPFEIYPHDIGVMTYVDAEKAVKKLNEQRALGHDDWQIPSLEELRLMYKNKDNTFCTQFSGSDYPQWYWSCTERRGNPSDVWNADFSDGDEAWNHKGSYRLSVRLVRSLNN